MIGLIFGDTNFPTEILKKIKSIKHVVIINYPGEKFLNLKLKNNIKNIGIPDKLIGHGNQDEILADINLDYNGILESVKDHIDIIDLKEKA